jgi:single-strand DNA-binding protein
MPVSQNPPHHHTGEQSMNLNRVLLIGNLTRDPEIRYMPKGTAVADIGLAINRSWKNDDGEKKEETTFVDVTLWGRQAEFAEKYLRKGRATFIEGRLHLDSWDDKQTGQKRSKLKVIGETMQLLGGRGESEGSSGPPAGQWRTAPTPRQRQIPKDPDLNAEPDDIPFRSSIYRDVRTSRLNRRVF